MQITTIDMFSNAQSLILLSQVAVLPYFDDGIYRADI